MAQNKKNFPLPELKEDLESLERYIEEFSFFLPLAVCTLNPVGVIVDINKSFQELTGYESIEIVGNPLATIFLDPKEIEKIFKELVKKRAIRDRELILVSKAKNEIPTSISLSVREDQAGNHIGYFVGLIDISETKRLRENLEQIVKERTAALEQKVSELKETEERLRRAYKVTRDIIDKAPFGVYLVNDKGIVEYTNAAMLEISGISYEEFISLNILKVPTYEKIGLPGKIEAGLRGQYFRMGPVSYTSHFGKKFTIRNFTGIPLKENGARKLMIIVEDVTEEEQAEAALREREKRFRDITENAMEWIWEVNSKGKYTYSSSVVEKILGYKSEEILKKHFYDLFHPQDREELKKAAFEAFAKKEPFREFINRNIHKNGQVVWLLTSGVPILDEKGNLLGYRGADIDVTESRRSEETLKERTKDLEEARVALINMLSDTETLRKEAEKRAEELKKARIALINMLQDAEESRKRIEEEKNKTRATLVSLTDGLIVFDKEKRITLINPEAERILDLKEAQILDKRIDQVTNFPNLAQLYQALGRKIEWTGQKYELVLEEPIQRFFQVTITPAVVDKEAVGLMIILHDVTREKEIDRMKTEFVSIAAHQLRTPLSSIKWILRIILDGDVGEMTEEQADLLEKGYQSNERMISLINDLLNVARIEEGRFVYNLTSQSLEEIIKRLLDSSERLIKQKKLKLIFKKPKTPLPKIKIDKEKIELVIQNLLDNAIIFNKPGGQVTISIDCDKMDIKVMVKDDGIGIPPSQQKRIFTKFFRADNAVRLATSGSGLGLFISKNVVEAHGGKIWFESEENQGTAFWFTLPIKK